MFGEFDEGYDRGYRAGYTKGREDTINNPMEQNNGFIYMYSTARRGERDWNGDFDYEPTALDCFKPISKLWECKCESNYSCHGYGCPGVAVKTTMEALTMLGWEELYEKYKTAEEKYNQIK